MLSSILGTDGSPLLSYLIVFLIMVVLLSLFAFGAKRFARGRLTLGGNGGTSRSRQPRLGIVDIYELDRQRQLILLRRDNTEHLLLVGGPNDVVVERNIVRAGAARVSAELADRPEPEAEAPLLPAGTEPAPLPPPFPEPELPRPSAPEPERVAAAFAPGPRPDVPMPDLGPEPSRPASRFNASRRVEPPSLRAARQTPPPLEVPPAEPPAFTAPVPPVVPVPPPMPEPVLPPEPAPAPAGTRGAEPRNVDAAILNDMARQLEEALRRPSSAVAPARPAAPVASPPPEPVAVPPLPVPPLPEPPRHEPAPPPTPPEPEPEPAPPEPPLPLPEPPPPPPEPEPAPPPPPEPEPIPEPPPPPPPPPPEEPAPPAKPASVQNPFSVEEIEAEFARLLGRPLDKR
ncbi:hypothetical protein SAMN02799631_01430 [Methylobacterium sp. 174MFSha1.1]|nr:hypothetical protein SAMN02799631_01430 [Methylobacterium sp. 174MFSha1.1]